MKILSLDASTKSTGWAVFEDTKLIDYGCITSASTDLIKRIYVMRDNIKEIIEKYEINKIILEEVRPEGGFGTGNIQTHRALMWLQAGIAFMIHDDCKKIVIDYVYPSSWRAACGIKNGRGVKRQSAKQLDIAFVKEQYGINVNDDIADAICIGHAEVGKLNNEINWE